MFISISSYPVLFVLLFLPLLLLVPLASHSTPVSAQSSIDNNNNSAVSSSAVPKFNPAGILTSRLEKIASLSNIVGASMIDGIQVSSINVGDTDLTVTLKRQITTSATSTTTTTTSINNTSNISLPVTVIAAKLPIANLTEIISAIEASRGLTVTTGSTSNPIDTANGQIGSNTATQSNAFQILSLLKNIQIGTASIVNANWTMPQTVSMGFLGLGNRIAESASSYFVLVVVVPFQGVSSMPTLELG